MESKPVSPLSTTIIYPSFEPDFDDLLRSPEPLNLPLLELSEEDLAALIQGDHTIAPASTTAEYFPEPSRPVTPAPAIIDAPLGFQGDADPFGDLNSDSFATLTGIDTTDLDKFDANFFGGEEVAPTPSPTPSIPVIINTEAQQLELERQAEELRRALEETKQNLGTLNDQWLNAEADRMANLFAQVAADEEARKAAFSRQLDEYLIQDFAPGSIQKDAPQVVVEDPFLYRLDQYLAQDFAPESIQKDAPQVVVEDPFAYELDQYLAQDFAPEPVREDAPQVVVEDPFYRQLEEALAQEAAREAAKEAAEQAISQAEESDELYDLPLTDPKKPWVKVCSQTKGLNTRPANINKFNPAEFYDPLLLQPQPWGRINPSTGEPVFQYTSEGELVPELKLTQNQLIEYICTHHLHSIDPMTQVRDGKNSNLRLYIQIAPADSSRRYPNGESAKCRYADCPIPRNIISKGQYRVCFDELSYLDLNLDPFHNAGYMHLYCMESCLDFPEICKRYNVLPDDRIAFREGKSKMSIIRDFRSMKQVVRNFVDNAPSWPAAGKPRNWYPASLSYALTKEHLRCEPRGRAIKRAERGGNHIEVHMNDLRMLATNKELLWAEKRQADQVSKKRKATDEEEEVGNSFKKARKVLEPRSRNR